MILSKKIKYLQVALNSTLEEAESIIEKLPVSDRIIIEAGTPLIKRYGIGIVSHLRSWWGAKVSMNGIRPYIVADLKTMDRGETEVAMAAAAGASAVVALGQSPVETVHSVIESCRKYKLDSMIDMMNVEYPIKVLRTFKSVPDVVILHRGVDEETYNKTKPIPYIQINKIRSSYNVMIAMAGGDTIREVQRAIFNDANIVVVWRDFYQSKQRTELLAEEFLREIK